MGIMEPYGRKQLFSEIILCSCHKRRSQRENRGDGVVTYPCQRDGPEGYDSPVPASERLGHRAQARAWQANNCTHSSQTHTQPNTHYSFHRHRKAPSKAETTRNTTRSRFCLVLTFFCNGLKICLPMLTKIICLQFHNSLAEKLNAKMYSLTCILNCSVWLQSTYTCTLKHTLFPQSSLNRKANYNFGVKFHTDKLTRVPSEHQLVRPCLEASE